LFGGLQPRTALALRGHSREVKRRRQAQSRALSKKTPAKNGRNQ
jgi:hypothetical protein